jgi:DNA-binding NtrC family response regulator
MTAILIVEDEKAIRDTQAELLGMSGFEVVTADSGSEAIRIIESRWIDVLLSDIHLGQESGLDLAYWAHYTHPEIAVILMTGYSSRRKEISWPLLMKPFLHDQVVELINKVLAQHPPASS